MSTTLASGANTTVTLPAGQVLYTGKTGSGTAVIGPGPQANQTFTLGTGARIGPYNNDVSVFLTSFAGSIDYQIGDAPGASPGNPLLLDPLGPSLSGDAADAVVAGARGPRDATFSQMQTAAAAGFLSIPEGAYDFPDTILMGSGCSVRATPLTTITGRNTFQHTLFRTGNAEFSAAASPIPGVSIYCADQVAASGTGTLRYTLASNSLAWQPPGASTFGSEVSLASVVDAASVNVLTIPGPSAGQAIYAYVAPAPARNANRSRTVRLEPVTGAKAMTWARASNVRTVTEAAHGRKRGDFAILFGASGVERFGFVRSVTRDAWTIDDTGADSSGSGATFGVRAVKLNFDGATLNYNKTGQSTALMSNLHAIVLLGASDTTVTDPVVTNVTKYAVLTTGYKNLRVSGVSGYRDDSSITDGNSDIFHVVGPGRSVSATDLRAQAGDNIVGVGTGDYYDYCFHPSAAGDLSLVGGTIRNIQGENTNQQPIRFYTAAGTNFIRNWEIDGVFGTYNTTADSAVSVITDAGGGLTVDAGATNIDGLTLRRIEAVRADGSTSSAFISSGSGTRRGLRVLGLRPRSLPAAQGSVLLTGGTVKDLVVEAQDGGAFYGAVVALTGTATVAHLKASITGGAWDNTAASTVRGALVLVNNASASIGLCEVSGSADDASAANKAVWVWQNAGSIGRIRASGIRSQSGMDSIVRNSAGTITTIQVSDIDHDGPYVLAIDAAGAASSIDIVNVRHNNSNGSSAFIQWNVSGANTVRLKAWNASWGRCLLKNVQGNTIFLTDALATEDTTGNGTIAVTAGTPVFRLAGPTDLSLAGDTLLDATVANHAANASFYNTAAGFGAGAGAYVRGSTTWTRVAA